MGIGEAYGSTDMSVTHVTSMSNRVSDHRRTCLTDYKIHRVEPSSDGTAVC